MKAGGFREVKPVEEISNNVKAGDFVKVQKMLEAHQTSLMPFEQKMLDSLIINKAVMLAKSINSGAMDDSAKENIKAMFEVLEEIAKRGKVEGKEADILVKAFDVVKEKIAMSVVPQLAEKANNRESSIRL
ncbi:MAG: hypothetical protein ACHQII_05720 [Bacteroidia bacterium]